MPMLEIVTSRKVQATVTLEESTAKLVNVYAAFSNGSGSDVVNKALEYIFTRDKDFQKYLADNPEASPTFPIRYSVIQQAPKGPKPGTKRTSTAPEAGK